MRAERSNRIGRPFEPELDNASEGKRNKTAFSLGGFYIRERGDLNVNILSG